MVAEKSITGKCDYGEKTCAGCEDRGKGPQAKKCGVNLEPEKAEMQILP